MFKKFFFAFCALAICAFLPACSGGPEVSFQTEMQNFEIEIGEKQEITYSSKNCVVLCRIEDETIAQKTVSKDKEFVVGISAGETNLIFECENSGILKSVKIVVVENSDNSKEETDNSKDENGDADKAKNPGQEDGGNDGNNQNEQENSTPQNPDEQQSGDHNQGSDHDADIGEKEPSTDQDDKHDKTDDDQSGGKQPELGDTSGDNKLDDNKQEENQPDDDNHNSGDQSGDNEAGGNHDEQSPSKDDGNEGGSNEGQDQTGGNESEDDQHNPDDKHDSDGKEPGGDNSGSDKGETEGSDKQDPSDDDSDNQNAGGTDGSDEQPKGEDGDDNSSDGEQEKEPSTEDLFAKFIEIEGNVEVYEDTIYLNSFEDSFISFHVKESFVDYDPQLLMKSVKIITCEQTTDVFPSALQILPNDSEYYLQVDFEFSVIYEVETHSFTFTKTFHVLQA